MANTERYLSREEVAETLGVSISTVDNFIKRGDLTYCRPFGGRRGRVLIPESGLQTFLKARTFRGTEPAESDPQTAASA